MFLSRITLADRADSDPRFWPIFEEPYRLHKAVWDLFADGPDRRRDFLYRLDQDGRKSKVFTLSARPPEDRGTLFHVQTAELTPRLRAGDKLRFDLRVNPVVTRDHSHRRDVVMDAKWQLRQQGVPKDQWPSDAQLAYQEGLKWLAARAEKHGFCFEPGQILVERYFIERFKKGRHQVSLAGCDFVGTLKVKDVDLFLASFEKGIGPAKGFGFGLMLIRRAGRS